MTSSTSSSARPSPMASTTSRRTKASSRWVSTMIRGNSRCKRSAAGGIAWDGRPTRSPSSSTSRRTAVGAMPVAAASSSSNYRSSPMRHGSGSRSLTIRPGTSKWNKIEHRMFCHITANWRAVPLESREIVVELISHTTTAKGLSIQAELDTNTYEKGRVVTKKEFAALALTRAAFHGEWNYTLAPRRKVP